MDFSKEHFKVEPVLARVATWYFSYVYGRWEGPGVVPFYCNAGLIGHFAVTPEELREARPATIFKVFITMSMYQARRDVLIMDQQRKMPLTTVLELTDPNKLQELSEFYSCEYFASASLFEQYCNVYKREGNVDCEHRTGLPCQVKSASVALLRTGDMGKLPTSAWLYLGKQGLLLEVLAHVKKATKNPGKRAELLVDHFSAVYRVGKKLATMFVSALSTPALAPDLAPWFPEIDGSSLVVVDTHVARAVDLLRKTKTPHTYEARAVWLQKQAKSIELSKFNSEVPNYSPRLLQQALYMFGSKSNRRERRDPCAVNGCTCGIPELCPFYDRV